MGPFGRMVEAAARAGERPVLHLDSIRATGLIFVVRRKTESLLPVAVWIKHALAQHSGPADRGAATGIKAAAQIPEAAILAVGSGAGDGCISAERTP